jgi:putative membrane protein
MKCNSILGLGAAFMLITSSSAFAQSDADFVKNVIQMNLAEIQMGQLAQANGASDDVKAFGRKMVEDHTTANQEAISLATAAGVTPPTEPPADAKKMHDELAGLSGNEFDRAFGKHMVQDHQKAADMFADKADDGDDQVSQFAQKNLPVIQQHLDSAKTLPGASG